MIMASLCTQPTGHNVHGMYDMANWQPDNWHTMLIMSIHCGWFDQFVISTNVYGQQKWP